MNNFVQVSKGIGNEMYKTDCRDCGGPVYTWVIRQTVKYRCKPCRESKKSEEKSKGNELRVLQAERRLEVTVEHLEKQRILGDYSNALDVIGQHIYRDGWLQSSNEILVALELLRKGIKARHQVKFGRWRADFVVPDLKVVLEVDGILYHTDKQKEKERVRDSAIIANLGPGWEVIRITEALLRSNVQKLVPAIRRVMRERAKVRQRNGQALPKWYSNSQV